MQDNHKILYERGAPKYLTFVGVVLLIIGLFLVIDFIISTPNNETILTGYMISAIFFLLLGIVALLMQPGKFKILTIGVMVPAFHLSLSKKGEKFIPFESIKSIYSMHHSFMDKSWLILETDENSYQIMEIKKSNLENEINELKKVIGKERWSQLYTGKKE